CVRAYVAAFRAESSIGVGQVPVQNNRSVNLVLVQGKELLQLLARQRRSLLLPCRWLHPQHHGQRVAPDAVGNDSRDAKSEYGPNEARHYLVSDGVRELLVRCFPDKLQAEPPFLPGCTAQLVFGQFL